MREPRVQSWSLEKDAEIRSLHQRHFSTRAIARETGLHRTQVMRRMKKMGLTDQPQKKIPAGPDHLITYKAARRGFHVPAHLEGQYYELLKTGVPIAEARRRLGIED